MVSGMSLLFSKLRERFELPFGLWCFNKALFARGGQWLVSAFFGVSQILSPSHLQAFASGFTCIFAVRCFFCMSAVACLQWPSARRMRGNGAVEGKKVLSMDGWRFEGIPRLLKT